MIISNLSKYDIVMLGEDNARIIKSNFALAKIPIPSSLYLKTGRNISVIYNIEIPYDKITIKDSKIINEVEVEVIK